MIQNVEHVEPEITTRDVAVVDEPIPETRADTGLWWLFAKPIVEEPIPETRADTGLWWLFAKPIVEEPIPETRADTGLWWLFAKPATVAIPQDNRVIIDTGIFDRPILIQNIEPVEPEVTTRNVTVTEESVPEASRVIIDTGIFDRPILIQNVEPVVEEVVPQNDRVIIDTGIFDRPILIQNVGSVEPEVTTRDIALAEEPTEETTRIIIDTGIFDRPILIQRPEEVVEVVKEMTGTVIDTGIFDRPIYIQESTNNVIENTREAPVMTTEEQQDYELRGDTSLWWLFYKQDNTNIIEIKRDVVPQQTIIQPLIRLPLAVDYLFEQPKVESISREAPVVEAPKSENIIQPLIRLPLAVDYLFEQPKNIETPREVPVEVTYQTPNAPYGYAPQVSKPPYGVDVESVSREAPVVEAPKSENIIQPLIRLPLAVDYLFEQPKVESVSREAPVVETSKSDNIIQPLIRLPLAVDYLFEKPTDNNNTETRDVSLANIENADSEVDRLKVIIDELTAKLEQKQQSEANLNGRVATLTLMLNEADKKNRDLSRKYDEKVNNLLARTASLNTQLAVVSLLSNEPRVSNKIADDCATINELMKEKNQSKISDDCATINELMKEMEQLKQQPVETTSREVVMDAPREVVAPANNDALMAKLAQINTQLAKVSLESNDEVRNLRKIVKENEQKIDDLQKSNARINGQLANLTLNVDETIRGLKNEPSNKIANDCATINELMKQMNEQPEITTRDVPVMEEVPKIANDCATIAQQNKYIAELEAQLNGNNKISDDCATINELMKEMNQSKISNDCATINELMKEMKQLKQQPSESNDVEKLRNKLGELNTQVAVLSLYARDMEKANAKLEKENSEAVDSLRTKLAELNTRLAVVSLNTPSYIAPIETANEIQSREIVVPEVQSVPRAVVDVAPDMEESLRSKAADINTRLALITLMYDDDVRALKNAQKEKDVLIEDLRNKAAKLNTNLATLTLDSNEECACLREFAVEKQLERDALRSSASQLNGQLANLTLNLDEILRSNNAYLNEKTEEVDFLRQCTVQLNQQLAQLTLSFDDIIKSNNGYMAKQQDEINKLTDKTTDLNGRLARLTLNYDEMNLDNQKKIKEQAQEIEKLQQKAADLNGSIAKLTLYFDEMAQQKTTPVAPEVATREVPVVVSEVTREVPIVAPIDNESNVQSDKFRDISVKLNQNLATLTLDYDTLKRESEAQQKADQQKIEYLQNERTKLNSNLAKVTLQYDEDITKKNRTIKNLNNMLNNSNVAYNNARRGSVVAKIQKIERLTDMSTNLNSNLARVTLEFNEMVQSKDAEINKLKDSLKNYEMGNKHRNSTITVEYNDVNYYNINTNAEKHSSKVMGSSDVPTPASVPEAPEAAHIAPAAEPEIVEVKEVVVEEDGKKKKRGKRSKSTSKKIVKKSNKYGDLSIEQRKAMNKELVNQSCNIL